MRPTALPTIHPSGTPSPDRRSVGDLPGSQGIGGLVLELARRRIEADGFPARRLRAAVASLPDPLEARLAGQVVRSFAGESRDLPLGLSALVSWAGHLESRGRLHDAQQIVDVAVELSPLDPELALHAARIARKAGDHRRARRLYEDVERLDDGSGRFARLGRVGHAMISPEAERELGRVLRNALRAGETEAAALAQEARALERVARGDRVGALRDLLVAAVRFNDPADAGRIGHRVADLLVAARLPGVARRVLEVTAQVALPEQGRWARARLYDLARLSGDQVGLRRWRDDRQAGLVSLSLARSRPGCPGSPRPTPLDERGSLTRTVERFLDRLQGATGSRGVEPLRVQG